MSNEEAEQYLSNKLIYDVFGGFLIDSDELQYYWMNFAWLEELWTVKNRAGIEISARGLIRMMKTDTINN